MPFLARSSISCPRRATSTRIRCICPAMVSLQVFVCLLRLLPVEKVREHVLHSRPHRCRCSVSFVGNTRSQRVHVDGAQTSTCRRRASFVVNARVHLSHMCCLVLLLHVTTWRAMCDLSLELYRHRWHA
jgi:hypothetical protein